MFGKRRYSALPTSSDPSGSSAGGAVFGGRRGGISFQQMKKYLVITLIGVSCVLLLLGGRKVQNTFQGQGQGNGSVDEYDGVTESEWAGMDDTEGFSSPPFNPDGSGHDPMNENAYQGSVPDEDDNDDEEEGFFNILPVPGKEKGTTMPDYAELDVEEMDDYPKNGGDSSSSGSDQFTPTGPQSFEEDPDPSATTYCETPYNADSPIIQYAITIDAGSTGSRIHVYKFNNCGPSPTLEYETFKALQPGLSSFAKDPTAAAASLDPLLEEAVRVVPRSIHSCTPIEVKATAGLRLLPGKEGEAILDEVRVRIESDWPFSLGKEDAAVEIMDGKDEGVYAWITANYLLGNIGVGSNPGNTIAVMDLGGASTQIVFEPTFPEDSPHQLAEGDHKYSLDFGGRDYTLYQHSYLGYGLMRARRSVHNLVAFTWSFLSDASWDDLDEETGRIPNPCLCKGMSRQVTLDPSGRKAVNVTMVGAESGFEACNRVVELVMAKDAICEVKPCSFNGVYQPSLLDTFPDGQLLALSYFTDRIQPLIGPFASELFDGESNTLRISTLETMAQEVCAGREAWYKRWGKDKGAMAELMDRPEYCLDLTFMHALLRLGEFWRTPRYIYFMKKQST